MTEYIERSAAVAEANYAVDIHPYDKDRKRPETYSDYNRGWNDACDYIQDSAKIKVAARISVPLRLPKLLSARWWSRSAKDTRSLCGEIGGRYGKA